MVGVAVEVDDWCARLVPEQHVLAVVVDEVFLLGRQADLTDEARPSQLLNDVQDVQLRVEPGARLSLQFVLVGVLESTTETPRTCKVFLPAEAPT